MNWLILLHTPVDIMGSWFSTFGEWYKTQWSEIQWQISSRGLLISRLAETLTQSLPCRLTSDLICRLPAGSSCSREWTLRTLRRRRRRGSATFVCNFLRDCIVRCNQYHNAKPARTISISVCFDTWSDQKIFLVPAYWFFLLRVHAISGENYALKY